MENSELAIITRDDKINELENLLNKNNVGLSCSSCMIFEFGKNKLMNILEMDILGLRGKYCAIRLASNKYFLR